MPIEIKEVVIKTVIDPQAGGGAAAGPSGGGGGSTATASEQQLIDKILGILEDKEER
jgi:hypothetical protein